MTIYNREYNHRLSNLERCAEEAPEGTYECAKEAAAVISDIANFVMSRVIDAGFKAPGDDRLRNLEVAVYQYLTEANPGALAAEEGFGEHVSGPHGARVLAQAVRDRDFLRALQR